MTVSISSAKEELLKGLRKAEEEVRKYNELLATFEAVERRSLPGLDQLPPVRSDEFKGMPAVRALEAYLRVRKGVKIPLPRAVADLVEGACDPGASRGNKVDPLALVTHTLKIGIPNRRDLFGYTPEGVSEETGAHVILKGTKAEDITVWLADEAEEPKSRRRRR
jgi:hypothetical protein